MATPRQGWPVEASEYVHQIETATAQLLDDLAAGKATIRRRQARLCESDLPGWINDDCKAIKDAAWKLVYLGPEQGRPPEWLRTARLIIEIAGRLQDDVKTVQSKAHNHWFDTASALLEAMTIDTQTIQKVVAKVPAVEQLTLVKSEQRRTG